MCTISTWISRTWNLIIREPIIHASQSVNTHYENCTFLWNERKRVFLKDIWKSVSHSGKANRSPRKTLSFLRCLHYLGYQKVWHVFEARIPSSQEGACDEEKDPRQGLSILFEVFSSSYTKAAARVKRLSASFVVSAASGGRIFIFSKEGNTPSLSRRCPRHPAKQQNTQHFSSRKTFALR